MRRPEAEGQEAQSREARADQGSLQGGEDHEEVLDGGQEGPSDLAEAEAWEAPAGRCEGEPLSQQGEEALVADGLGARDLEVVEGDLELLTAEEVLPVRDRLQADDCLSDRA